MTTPSLSTTNDLDRTGEPAPSPLGAPDVITDASNTTTLLSALQASHDRLNRLLTTIPAEAVTQPAYPTEWSIAQVASHLGSQAETFLLTLDAGLHGTGTAAPGLEQFQPIWDGWNAKHPTDQVSDCLISDQALLDAVDALTDTQRRTWVLPMMGTEQNLSDLLRMRLLEHILHTWDIDVALDATASLPADAAALVIDQLSMIVRYTAKPTAPLQIRVETVEPDLTLQLSLDPGGSQLETTRTVQVADPQQTDTPQQTPTALRLPTEAFVRLV